MVLQDLCDNYQKLINNVDQLPAPLSEKMVTKLTLIDQRMTDLTIAIEDLNFQLMSHRVQLTETETQEYQNMQIANRTVKALSPYIMWFNLYQKLAKDKEGELRSPMTPSSSNR